MSIYNTASDAANTAVRAFLTKIGEHYFGKSFNTGSGKSKEVWIEIRDEIFDGRCAYCGKEKSEAKLQMDHLIMFNRREYGLHHPGNIVPACTKCNKRTRNDSKEYHTWEEHLSAICESNEEGGKFLERWKRIRSHVNDRKYAYPDLTSEEMKALRIITNNLYESIKREFEEALKLYKELDKEFSKN